MLNRLEQRGVVETAHRARTECGQVFGYAIATGRATRDISADLRGALQPIAKAHYATLLDPTSIGGLLAPSTATRAATLSGRHCNSHRCCSFGPASFGK